MIKDIELQSIVNDYLRKKPEEEFIEDPIVRAAEETRNAKKSKEAEKAGSGKLKVGELKKKLKPESQEKNG